MARAIEVVRRVTSRPRPNYLAALDQGDHLFKRHDIVSPARLSHFLAQILHESGGLKLEWENMNYSAKRMIEIFGVGRHSAGVTPKEAKRLAGKPQAVAERVYGLGNPRKADALGNSEPGDGFRYRGGGLMQTTGRFNYRAMGKKCGVDFENNPELVISAEHALKPALAEWTAQNLNSFADANDILSISRAINFGNPRIGRRPNGMQSRMTWFASIQQLLDRVDFELGEPAPLPQSDIGETSLASLIGERFYQVGNEGNVVRAIQLDLAKLGYPLRGTGYFGGRTDAAVTDFQRLHNIEVDGVVGAVTARELDRAIAEIEASSGGTHPRKKSSETGNPIGEPLTGHKGGITIAAFSPNGKRIVTASYDQTARLWDAETGKPIGAPLKGHKDGVTTAAFSPDGKRIVTASSDKTARLWDAETGKPIVEPLKGHSDAVTTAVFSPDGKLIVTTSSDKTARLWDVETGKPIGKPLRGHSDAVTTAGFSPDGKRIITASHDNTAQLWDAEYGTPTETDGRPLWVIEGLKWLDTREVRGSGNNLDILNWARGEGGQIAKVYEKDSIPWCALYANMVLTKVGIKGTETLWALDWNKWGKKLGGPAIGAFAPMKRKGGGHIAIVVGRDQHGHLMCLGGNQNDAVNIKPFPKKRPLSFRWPLGEPLPVNVGFNKLPIINSDGRISKSEA